MKNYTWIFCCLFSLSLYGQETINNETRAFVNYERGAYIFQNLSIVDGTNTAAQSNMDIWVEGSTIKKIGKDLSVPKGVKAIDMQGKSAMPGMVMLHEHMFYPKATNEGIYGVNQMSYSFPKLYLAGGVTTMRTAGSIMPQADVNIKKRINRGDTPGPKMDVTSPHMDRAGLGIYELGPFETTEQAVRAVHFYADMGVNSIKVYNFITREDLKAILEAAHQRGMKVTGHLCSITYREAADLGIDNLEHGFFASSDFIEDKRLDDCDPFKSRKSLVTIDVNSQKVTELINHLVKKNVALTSTINVFEPYTNREVVPGGGLNALYTMSKERVYDRWVSMQGRDSINYVVFNKAKVWEKAFYDAGGLLVAGTDPTYDGRIVAGYANMRLLELFVEMGFSIPEAVKICTLNGAKYLEVSKTVGTLEVGKTADILFMSENIADHISAIRSIETVFKNGIGYNSKKLFKSAEGLVGIR